MASSEEDLEEVQQRLSKGEENQQPDEGSSPNNASRIVLKEIDQIEQLGDTAPVPESHAAVQPASNPELDTQVVVSAAKQRFQSLKESEKTGVVFKEAILSALKTDLSPPEQEKYGPYKMLELAEMKLASDLIQFDDFLKDLIEHLLLASQERGRAIEEDFLAKVFKVMEDLEHAGKAARRRLDPLADSGDTSAGISSVGAEGEAYVGQDLSWNDHQLQVTIKLQAGRRVTQFLEQEDRRSLQDFRVAVFDTFIASGEGCCRTARNILNLAYNTYADKVELVPLLDDLIRHLRDPQCVGGPFDLLLLDACTKRHQAVEWYGTESDDYIAGSSIAEDIPLVPETVEVHCTTVIFRGQETRLYLTTHAPPLIVTLLNGLALSDQGHLIGAHKETLNMEEMLDLVVETCKTRLNVTGPLPCAESWKLLANRLDFSWEAVENQIKTGNVSVFLQTLRADVLEEYFKQSTMRRRMVPFNCRLLFDVLQVVIKGPGMATDPRRSSSPQGPKKIGHEGSDPTAESKDVQLVDEGASQDLLARTENTEKALEQKSSSGAEAEEGKDDDEVAASVKTVVKQQVLEGPSATTTLAAMDSPGSKDQGVEDTVQCGEEGVRGGPAFPAPPGMPRLDVKTYEGLQKAYCGENDVKTFIYAAEGQATLHVMAAVGDELFVLNERTRPQGRSHGRGPVPRWFRLALGIHYVPEEPKCYQATGAPEA